MNHVTQGENARRSCKQYWLFLLLLVWLPGIEAAYAAVDNPIPLENQNPGTASWQAGYNGQRRADDVNGQILGYASARSVNKGGSIEFYVSVNPVQTFTLSIYRLGWYGGAGGRLMQQVGPLVGVTQPPCPQDAQSGLTECRWSSSYTLAVPSDWTTGIYLVVLDNEQNYQNRLTFVVRDDSRVADFVYQQPVTTYQAYNNYPNNAATGKSLYNFNSYGATTISGARNAVKVSFDRPGGEQFENWEVYLVHWLERMQYDVSYTTDIDTHVNGARLLNFKGVFSAGHDEYWSKEMFDAFEQARDRGVNLAFWGANPAYWQIRFEPSSSGVPNRVIVCYKSRAIDPNPDANLKTDQFRALGRPEQTLVGVQYTADGDFDVGQTLIVQNSTHWFWQGTGFADGSAVAGLIGYEIDRLFPNYSAPISSSYTTLARSPYQALESVTGTTSDTAEASIYQAPSTAWVFATGTMDWSWALDRPDLLNAGIQRATQNLLDRFLASGQQPPPLSATVLAPNGGEKLFVNVATTIRWLATAAVSIDVALSTDGGNSYSAIPGCSGLPGTTTSCNWTPTGPETTTALIRVTAHSPDSATATDLSNAAFTIAAVDNPIPLENQNPGTASWQAGYNGQRRADDVNGQILGYASARSVNKGGSIEFYVSVNPVQTFTLSIYRLGWYGGAGGRLMQQVGPLVGVTQPPCPQDAQSGLTECRWSSSYTLAVPSDWTTGIYLVVLDNGQNYQNRLTFVVRDDSRVADFVYQQPVTTYQAYNNYPNNAATGKSLYNFNSYGATTISGARNAVKVSFDRPGGEQFENWEVYLVHWLERMQYDVSYTTDIDTHVNGARLLNFKGVFSAGHDEYWSKEMFDAFEQARDRGVNLAFWGANPAYWQIRFEPSSSGVPNRVIVCYKSRAIDPNPDANLKTDQFRALGRPEQTLVGVQYTADGDFDVGQTLIVQNSTHWFWQGTGFADGSAVAGLIGYEIDRLFPNYSAPISSSYTTLARSPYQALESVTGTTSDTAEASIYQAPSTAWVFATGTMDWSWALDRPDLLNAGIQRATQNLLDRFLASGQQPPPLSATVLAPNGGEKLFVNVATTIRWLATAAVSIDVALSTDGGNSYSAIPGCSGLPGTTTSCNWTPTGPETTTALIRVTAHSPDSATATDLSNAVFTIVTPVITVTAPNTNVNWVIGSSHNVTWTHNLGAAESVRLEWSADGGTTWTPLANSVPNGTNTSGSFNWTVTGPVTNAARIRVVWTKDSAVQDMSDVNFSVASRITVTAPNTNVTWGAGSVRTVTWNHNYGAAQAFDIAFSPDNGATWSQVASGIPAATATTGSYSGQMPTNVTTQALMRVSPAGNAGDGDVSNVPFTLASPTVTVTSPNTNVNWVIGSSHNVTWTHNLGAAESVRLEWSADGGTTWTPLANSVPNGTNTSGSFNWTVTGPVTNAARVRVVWTKDSAVQDMSDVNFSVTSRITVTAPNTNVTWGAGSVRTVTWNHNYGAAQAFDIAFSPDNGATWSQVASGIPAATATTGSYSGQMPTNVTTQALMRVSPAGNAGDGDVSNVPFTLASPTVTVTSPNTNVNWVIGSSHNVTWTHNLGTAESVRIELSTDGGATWTTVSPSVTNSANTSGSFSWTVTGPATSTARIRVTWIANGAVQDISNVNFRIQ